MFFNVYFNIKYFVNKLNEIYFFFLNLLGHNVTFQSETGHLISIGSKTTDFYVKYDTELKWVHSADFLRN